MSQQPPPPPGGPFGSVGAYPKEPPQPNDHDLSRPAFHANRYEFGSSPDSDKVLAANPLSRSDSANLRVSITGFIGAALVALSAFTSWTAGALAHNPAAKPSKRALSWLWDLKALSTDSPKLIIAILVAAGLALIGAILVKARWLLIVGGVLAVAIGGMHVKQLNALTMPDDSSFLRLVGIGAWACIAGGLIAIVGGFISQKGR